MGKTQTITEDNALSLSMLLAQAVSEQGLTRESLAENCERWLRGRGVEIDVSTQRISALFRGPVRPLQTEERRHILSAAVAVLGVDRNRVNWLVGGVWGD